MLYFVRYIRNAHTPITIESLRNSFGNDISDIALNSITLFP